MADLKRLAALFLVRMPMLNVSAWPVSSVYRIT